MHDTQLEGAVRERYEFSHNGKQNPTKIRRQPIADHYFGPPKYLSSTLIMLSEYFL